MFSIRHKNKSFLIQLITVECTAFTNGTYRRTFPNLSQSVLMSKRRLHKELFHLLSNLRYDC